MRYIIDMLRGDRVFTLYFIAVSILYFSPLVMLIRVSREAGIAAVLTWSIPFIFLYLGSIYLFLIARCILSRRESVLSNFKGGLVVLALLTLAMLSLGVLSGSETGSKRAEHSMRESLFPHEEDPVYP
jgi:hypothetical protein